ncbi:hypothetical protein HPT27_10490 [Permianibacter sp. IMCC34836]|uniref:hypothetical protein n=1 Tax=Permianibacter fluminis TaxID=2738515 RepID=UPI001557174C|nr:hypothetical protein [Permianibacter fluminis]NQD37456.1 hypothetical protein [Permianibacter fluminis]
MLTLSRHPNATADLREIRLTDPISAAQILALLKQLEADAGLLDKLTWQDFENDLFEVQPFVSLRKEGYDIWRLKVFEDKDKAMPYRIIHAYQDKCGVTGNPIIHVLAIVHRKFNYDRSHPITQRVVNDYRQLVGK